MTPYTNVYITGSRDNYRSQVMSNTADPLVAFAFTERRFDYANDAIEAARKTFPGCCVYLNSKFVTW